MSSNMFADNASYFMSAFQVDGYQHNSNTNPSIVCYTALIDTPSDEELLYFRYDPTHSDQLIIDNFIQYVPVFESINPAIASVQRALINQDFYALVPLVGFEEDDEESDDEEDEEERIAICFIYKRVEFYGQYVLMEFIELDLDTGHPDWHDIWVPLDFIRLPFPEKILSVKSRRRNEEYTMTAWINT